MQSFLESLQIAIVIVVIINTRVESVPHLTSKFFNKSIFLQLAFFVVLIKGGGVGGTRRTNRRTTGRQTSGDCEVVCVPPQDVGIDEFNFYAYPSPPPAPSPRRQQSAPPSPDLTCDKVGDPTNMRPIVFSSTCRPPQTCEVLTLYTSQHPDT